MGGCITRQDGFMMCTQKVETLEPFSPHVIPVKMTETHTDEHINMMVQALHDQDDTLLPGPNHTEHIYQTEKEAVKRQ